MIGLGTFLSALMLSYLGTVLLLRLRLRRSFVDMPNERSSHEVPKPRIGGLAIFAAFLVVFLALFLLRPDMAMFVPLLLGALIIFATGALDDWRSLPVWLRFIAQGGAALVVISFGNVVREISLPLLGTLELGVAAVPFTFLFILTSINFYNFVDGIDGLAAGSAVIISSFLALIAYMLGHVSLALVCLAVAGSAVGFLQFNFPPSRLFMGDGGSTFLGFFFAFVAVSGNRLTPEIPFFVPVLLLSSLYLDAGLTLFKRLVRGEKIFEPHHTHYYQRLLSLGLNHKQVTVLEYGLTVLLGISSVIFFKAGGFFPVFLTLCWLAVFTVLILKIRSLERGDRHFWERRTFLVIASDVALITAAYFGAFLIRMNFRFEGPESAAMLKAFPVVLVVRSACFYWYGLYRGVWKYTSTPDVLRIIKAVTTGSAIILVTLVLFTRFVSLPRSLFVIEFFLLIIGIGGSRFASRLFHEFGREALGANIKRVAIIGAGDFGERLGREIRSTDGKQVSVVCYIDDDKEKSGLSLQGVPITGPIDELAEICAHHNVDSLVLGISELDNDKLRSIVKIARDNKVPVETKNGVYAKRSEPAIVLFDRVGQALDRTLPSHIQKSTATYFADKSVLVTNGGDALGIGLVRELLNLGARVTVQTNSAWEMQRFADQATDRLALYVGGIDRELDMRRAADTAEPDVVFHCVGLRAAPAVNEQDFVWRRVIRSTEAMLKVLPRYPIESVVFLSLWEDLGAESQAAQLLSVAEAAVLNSGDFLPLTPKAVRLPALLNENDLRSIINGVDPANALKDKIFAVLETEGVALALDVAAAYKGRAIVVPASESAFSTKSIEAVFRGKPTIPTYGEAEVHRLPSMLYPSEMAKASILPGAREVMSSLYPATDAVFDAVAQCIQAADAETLDASLATVKSVLFERTKREIST